VYVEDEESSCKKKLERLWFLKSKTVSQQTDMNNQLHMKQKQKKVKKQIRKCSCSELAFVSKDGERT